MKVGLIINPLAGIGGSVGLKGSDGADVVAEAWRRGATANAERRAETFLTSFIERARDRMRTIEWFSAGGVMGGHLLDRLGIPHVDICQPGAATSAEDTAAAVAGLRARGVALLLFAGGDGTARDILPVAGLTLPVIGIPAGVKMHSGVFATSPRAAAELLAGLMDGELIDAVRAEVRDVDEVAAREGRAASRYFGELLTPVAGGFVQHTKVGGREDDALALEEVVQGVCALVSEMIVRPLVLGPGGSMLAIKQRLGGTGTLLGVDVRLPDGSWLNDVGAADLLSLSGRPLLILSFGRQQGILFGRGNQQLCPGFLARLDRAKDIVVVTTRSKLRALEGRPLLLDTGDADLDASLTGVWELLCGFEERLLYRVEAG